MFLIRLPFKTLFISLIFGTLFACASGPSINSESAAIEKAKIVLAERYPPEFMQAVSGSKFSAQQVSGVWYVYAPIYRPDSGGAAPAQYIATLSVELDQKTGRLIRQGMVAPN